jgi:flagellar FliL protein
MADEELDLDVKKGGKSTLIIIILVVVLLLAGGGIGAFLFLGGGDEAGEGEAEEVAEVEPAEAHYLPLKPEFTVNFADDKKASFLQVEITVMARETDALDAVQTHMPVIQNNILNILSSKSYDGLISREGKDKLAQEILVSIQQVLEEEIHKPGVEAVYFTSFVMQ